MLIFSCVSSNNFSLFPFSFLFSNGNNEKKMTLTCKIDMIQNCDATATVVTHEVISNSDITENGVK